MSIATDMIAQLALVLAREGTPGVLLRAADPPGATGLPLRFLMRHPSLRDEAVVNAYGLNALIVTLPHLAAFESAPPEKFDRLIRPSGDPLPYVFDSCVRREIGGVLIGWTAFIKGKGG